MLTQIIVLLNELANAIAAILLAPTAWLPGWLSLAVAAIVTGVLMLYSFKYTSNQAAIKRTRNQIKANLLALSLFKEDVFVGLRSQRRLLWNAGCLLGLSLVPMVIMLLPMCLLLGQLALWYQARPLQVNEEAVVTVRLNDSIPSDLDNLSLVSNSALTPVAGPVHVPSKHLVCWNVQARSAGSHQFEINYQEKSFDKQFVVGDGFALTSIKRPSRRWFDVLLNPHEPPFPADCPVQSIEIDYPKRHSWTAGSDSWLVYWFTVSLVAAFAVRPILKVNI